MISTSLILQKAIPGNFQEIIKDVTATCSKLGVRSFLVGAFVRDLIFQYAYETKITRATVDIDFGVAVESEEEFESLKKALINTGRFVESNTQWQRLYRNQEGWKTAIDLMPFGGIESPAGTVKIENGDFELSTVGFDKVYDDCWNVEIADDLEVKIASPRGLVLLKLVSFSDRPFERIRDLQDIYYTARNYEKIGNEDRIYDADKDILEDEDFDYETVGARLLGRDLGALINKEIAGYVMKPLTEEKNGGTIEKFADEIRTDKNFEFEGREFILTTLRQIRMGVDETLQA